MTHYYVHDSSPGLPKRRLQVESEGSINRAAERGARSTRIKGVLLVTVSSGSWGGLGARPVSVKLTAGDTLHASSQSTVERGHPCPGGLKHVRQLET